jgi:GNAT superfamily N-acetyltransferase
MANVVSDLLAPTVWHIGTFIVATSRHGRGDAQVIYDNLEAWARRNGAQWLRLGVVKGNLRAEHFWERQGFAQTRLRPGVSMGRLTNLAGAEPARGLTAGLGVSILTEHSVN